MSERKMIPASKLEANRFNPNVMENEEFGALRKDVAQGNYDDVVVSPKDIFYSDPALPHDEYVIVDGQHRWEAATKENVDLVKCEIRPMKEDEAKGYSYRKNRERGHMDPLKEAQFFQLEIDAGLTEPQIAEKYNVSRSYVASRRSLLKLDDNVIRVYREPEKTLQDLKREEYEEDLKNWQEWWKEELEGEDEEEKKNALEEKPKEEDYFVPRGTLSPSHLEAIASLPSEQQVKIAQKVLDRGLSVRETEEEVAEIKEEIAERERFQEALAKAKRPKCPKCGSDPSGFGYYGEDYFKCSNCYSQWEHQKTSAEVEAEKKERMKERIDAEEREAAERAQRLKEARENPSFVKLPETPEELHERVKPWLLRKLQQLTEISDISVTGKRGDEEITLSYESPGEYKRMSLDFQVEAENEKYEFDFDVESKEYKKTGDRSRINMGWRMEASEENRGKLRRFFTQILETDRDPWDSEPMIRTRITELPKTAPVLGSDHQEILEYLRLKKEPIPIRELQERFKTEKGFSFKKTEEIVLELSGNDNVEYYGEEGTWWVQIGKEFSLEEEGTKSDE